MLLYQLMLWFTFLVSYIGLRYLFGTRIYYNEQNYLTVREIMLPLLMVLFDTSCKLIVGYSWFSFLVIACALIGLVLLYDRRKKDRLVVKLFVHHYVAVVFLVFELMTIVIQIFRFI